MDKYEIFQKRTTNHINNVKYFLRKIIKLNDDRINVEELKEEYFFHDISKFQEPEYTPYVELTISKLDPNYKISKETRKKIHEATMYHVTTNKHHPEFWSDNPNIDINNRDKSKEIVDATKMPLTYVACMCADWMGMSVEFKNSPYEWAEKNVNKRWKFTDEQVSFIYYLFDLFWDDELIKK